MEDPRNLARQCRERWQERKELAVKSCYSIIIVIVALVVLRPLMVDQILSRAEAYCAAGLMEESQRQCDKALFIDDDSSRAWCQSARLFKMRGEREAAIGAYEKAVQADRTNGPAHYELALMYVDGGRHQTAIPYLEQVRRLGPDGTKEGAVGQSSCYKDALHLLLLCYQKVGDPVKTEVTLKELRAFYPDSRDLEDHLQSVRQNGPGR